MSKIPVKPVSRQTIWEFVKTLKRALAVENDLFFDIVYFLEYVMPIIFPDFVLEICPQEEMGNLHGETIPSEHKIRIREDVYIGACNGKGRDRLTVAHEIGHYFMHDEKSIVERIGHVGIYLGKNYILHTASDYAVIEPISSFRWSYYILSKRVV